MGKISGPEEADPLLPRPLGQGFHLHVAARRPAVLGVEVQIKGIVLPDNRFSIGRYILHWLYAVNTTFRVTPPNDRTGIRRLGVRRVWISGA
jgi:hypothetical protein